MKQFSVYVLVLAIGFAAAMFFARQSGTREKLAIGDVAPEITGKTPQGTEISLASFRGRMVLVDFWASWCAPCRMENPNVVATCAKYKNAAFQNGTVKGFTVFSVSLDTKKEAWRQAIQNDTLAWEAHVSDLQGWNSKEAFLYGVRGIPTNFLLDEKGVIIAKHLRGEALSEKLADLNR